MKKNIQISKQDDFMENPKTKSTFQLITKVIVLDSLISFWVNIKEVISVFQFYLTYGLFPNKKQVAFDQQLLFTKKIIGIYLLLSVFKIVLLELSKAPLNVSNLNQYIAEIFIVIFYYLGIIIFCLLGKLIAFVCYRKHNKRVIESYMLGEFNFLFLLYFFLIFFGIIKIATYNTDNMADSLASKLKLFCLLTWVHSFYSYFLVFKQNISFVRFKRTLIIFPIIIAIVMFIILLFISTFDSLKFLQKPN